MRESDINILLQKAEELKALFVLGQRVIPFIEEIFIFIKETSPLLDEISTSIHENLQRMPKAAKQLSKVTEATESATNEIMDTVDGLVYKSSVIATNLAQIKTLADGNETITAEQFTRLVNNSEELLKSIKRDSQGIMMALQVQDITSQQIAAVNSVIDAVQTKLGKLTNRLEAIEFIDLIGAATAQRQTHSTGSSVSKLHRTIAFDPDAVDSLSNNETRQAEVDALFSGEVSLLATEMAASVSKESTDAVASSQEGIGTDDIDALFGNNSSSSDDEISVDDIDALFGNSASTSQTASSSENESKKVSSQDDIDALFNNNAGRDADSDDPFSQDDIDALFK